MRVRGPFGLLVLVCAIGGIARSASAASVTVSAGGDLQAAIDAAQAGDVILLQPGATFAGNFVLRNKGPLSDYITIRSAASDAQLPPVGTRITPAASPLLPVVRSANSAPAMVTEAGANHWRLMFVEFQSNAKGYGDILDLGSGSQTDLSQVPYALIVDRVYMHGDPVMGQKRGIGLNSRDTTIESSYIADCKAVGQDSQAIGGWNGPGNYLIENNYLEAAGENFLIGGADPSIPNLVPSNITFRHNHLFKQPAWRDGIVPTPSGVAATFVPGAGALAAGTYAYRIVARMPAGQTTTAQSSPSAEVMVAAGAAGAVSLTWTPVPGATDYLVYGRAAGAENVYWKTATPYFADAGAAGTSGTPPKSGTTWSVKNLFELKNASDVVVEGNVMEYLWVGGQPGFAVQLTPRNQSGTAPWSVVQRVTFRDNLVRHSAGGINILGWDDLHPSQQGNHITIQNNVFDDLTGASWGTGSRPFQIGAGADSITIDHNTVVTTDTSIVWLYGAATTNVVYTNNMSAHNSYGIDGSGSSPGLAAIGTYLPAAIVQANVLAGGSASRYPSGNFFPSVASWQAGFVDYAGGDYHLSSSSPYRNAGTDGADLGANIDVVNGNAANAVSGDNTVAPGSSRVQIVTTSLSDAVYGQPYSQPVVCSGGSGPCAWLMTASSLPSGIVFDAANAVLSGTPLGVGTGAITLQAYDPAWPDNVAVRTLALTVDAPPVIVSIPTAPMGQVGRAYQLAASATGIMGTAAWSIASGALPAGLQIDPFRGVIQGVPAGWGTSTALVQASDTWGSGRSDAKPVAITIAPAPLAIATSSLANARTQTAYSVALTATGGTGAVNWSIASGSLPSGLALAANGVLSGTPTDAGTFTFTVLASDANWTAYTASRTLSLIVESREVVLYATDATVIAGTWSLVADAAAANGYRIWNPDRGVPKLTSALALPANYFEMQFDAQAGVAYHLWLRGIADRNYWGNDSVMVQFSNSVDANGAPIFRIGTTSGSDVNLEDCSGCGLSGWGWQDNGWGVNVLGPSIYFATSGRQTIRVQVKEDGFSIDQIVLSADKYLTTSPGALKNDATILGR